MASPDVSPTVVEPLFRGPLPVRLRAWDGSEAGPADAPVVVLRTPDALRRIVFRPGELGLAQAYVTGELEVEGDLLDGFRRVWARVREAGATGRVTPSVLARGLRTARDLGRDRPAPSATGVGGPAARPPAHQAA